MFFESHPYLPPELRQHISVKKLKDNRNNYDEFDRKLSPEDKNRLVIIQQRLRALPLVHCSRNPELQELTATKQLAAESGGNTYSFDKSLGLDKYVFLHWGLGDWAQYGQHLYCYPTALLFRPTTLASPYDVLNIAIGKEDMPYDQVSEETKLKVQKYYFDLMLSGRDWFHLMSLRILEQLRQGSAMIPITYQTLGEIKVLNSVGSPSIAEYHGRSDIEQNFYGKQMYPNGFIFENIHHRLKRGLSPGVDPRPTPDQMKQIEQAWQ